MVCDNLMSLPLTPTVIFSQLSSTILCLDEYSLLSVRIWVQMLSSILSIEPLEELDLSVCELSGVDMGLFGEALKNVRKVKLSALYLDENKDWI